MAAMASDLLENWQSSSELMDGIKPNLVQLLLGWSPFKFFFADAVISIIKVASFKSRNQN
jgi:hypothetical protein